MSFPCFYETWFNQLRRLVDELAQGPTPRANTTRDDDHHNLGQLVEKLMAHYAEYYRVKSAAVKHDVLAVFSSPWSTSLERSLHWIGGWRPTTAFHLLYTQSSILFESQIADILRGVRTGDLADLSPDQFRCVSDLQCDTVGHENAISDGLAEWQDGWSDFLGKSTNIDGKIERLVRIVEKADELRLATVRKVVELLTPPQAVDFLIAAAELQFGVRSWGLNQDRLR